MNKIPYNLKFSGALLSLCGHKKDCFVCVAKVANVHHGLTTTRANLAHFCNMIYEIISIITQLMSFK